MNRAVIIYPLPEGDWSIEDYADPSKIILKGIKASSITIADASDIFRTHPDAIKD